MFFLGKNETFAKCCTALLHKEIFNDCIATPAVSRD